MLGVLLPTLSQQQALRDDPRDRFASGRFLREGNFRWLFVTVIALSLAMLAWVALMERDAPQAVKECGSS